MFYFGTIIQNRNNFFVTDFHRIEGKFMLIPKFGNKNENYQRYIKRVLIDKWQWLFLLFIINFNIIGIFLEN